MHNLQNIEDCPPPPLHHLALNPTKAGLLQSPTVDLDCACGQQGQRARGDEERVQAYPSGALAGTTQLAQEGLHQLLAAAAQRC